MNWKCMSELCQLKSRRVVSELVKGSIRHFLIIPGPNSTHLNLAATHNPLAHTITHFDERALAYHAIGMARATSIPTCLICDSPAALTNIYSALIEAHIDNIPIIIISSRVQQTPSTLTSFYADDQKYEDCLNWKTSISCSDPYVSEDTIASAISYSIHRATSSPQGPVLINTTFITPTLNTNFFQSRKTQKAILTPKIKYFHGTNHFDQDVIKSLSSTLSSVTNGVILIGRLNSKDNGKALSIAEKLKWPIFATPSSQIRGCDTGAVIQHYNLILQTVMSNDHVQPDAILHLGQDLESKAILRWMDNTQLEKYIHVNDTVNEFSPYTKASHKIDMDCTNFCKQLDQHVQPSTSCDWLTMWKEYALTVKKVLSQIFQENKKLSEPFVMRSIATQNLTNYFFAGSLVMKYAETFFFPSHLDGYIYSPNDNSYIGGPIATLLGIARVKKDPLIAVIGTSSFLRDTSSLVFVNHITSPVVLVLLNDNENHLYNLLPTSAKTFAQAFDITYFQPSDKHKFTETLTNCLNEKRVSIIEVVTETKKKFHIHEKISEQLKKNLL